MCACVCVCAYVLWVSVVVLSPIMVPCRYQGEFKATTDREKNNLHLYPTTIEYVRRVAINLFFDLLQHSHSGTILHNVIKKNYSKCW